MADVFAKAKRSEVMSRIRSRGNPATELALVRVFRAHGITGWRRHRKLRVGELRVESRKQSTSPRPSPQRGEGGARMRRCISQPSTFNSQLTVRPDFVFPKLKLAVFVDGCFWHACPRHCRMPAGNRAFWRAKLARNQARDRLVSRTMRKAGWRVLRVWEHALRGATTKRGGRNAERGMVKGRSTPHPGRIRWKLVRRTSSGLRPPPPQSGEGHLPVRGGEGAEARLLKRIQKALGSSPRPSP